MAHYTVSLQTIIESGHNIFDFPYTFYDESKKAKFEESFIHHFYFREIGCETVDRFKHYLKDKMLNTFPYYNELLKTATIEYDKINNYNVTESYSINRQNKAYSKGLFSGVGQFFDEQLTDTSTEGNTTLQSNLTGESNDTQKETITTEQNKTGNTVSEGSETSTTNQTGTSSSERERTSSTNGTSSTITNATTENDKSENINKKFLDTPQGLTDLTNSKYLTTLNQDALSGSESITNNSTVTGSEGSEGSETENTTGTTSNKSDTTANTKTETDATENTTGETERNLTGNSSVTQDTTGNENRTETGNIKFSGEQKSTTDSNSRNETEGTQKEMFERKMYGNIGVQTSSDMLEKHIKLQETLQKINLMFFNECEDLFMLVY